MILASWTNPGQGVPGKLGLAFHSLLGFKETEITAHLGGIFVPEGARRCCVMVLI